MSVPQTARGRDFVRTLRGWFIDSDGTFDEDAIAVWTSEVAGIEAEAVVLGAKEALASAIKAMADGLPGALDQEDGGIRYAALWLAGSLRRLDEPRS